MAGTKGRSGGSNRISAADHILRGTFRADRHGPRPSAASAAAAVSIAPAERPTPAQELVAGLGESGRRLVEELHARYEFSPVEQIFLRIAASRLDVASSARATVARDGLMLVGPRGGRTRHPMLAVERQAMKDFADAMRQLRLPTQGN